MSKCNYPNCQAEADYKHLCREHQLLYLDSDCNRSTEDWLEDEREQTFIPEKPQCYYPDCQNSADTHAGIVSVISLCDFHYRTQWQGTYAKDPFNWLKQEFERLHTLSKPALKEELSVLQEADLIVNGNRATDYGDAVESFKRISIMATIMATRVISPLECCLVLKAVKLVRESNHHKRDNLVDECGYVELENRIREWQETWEATYESFMDDLRELVE